MQRLRIIIDPILKKNFGTEISWTWRQLLIGIGFSWQEVFGEDLDCDIFYCLEKKNSIRSRICINSDIEKWKNHSKHRLSTTRRFHDWSFPFFCSETSLRDLFHIVDGCIVFERDILFDFFWLVTGQEEPYFSKDRHGFFDFSGTVFQSERVFQLALASEMGSCFEKLLAKIGFNDRLNRWPNRKSAAACISHDVDYPEIVKMVEPFRIFHRQGIQGIRAALCVILGIRNHWHIPSWIEMEKKMGIQSGFYFVARQGSILKYAFGIPDPFYDIASPRFKKMFRYLKSENFEIGMHASYEAYQDSKLFLEEKQRLEEATDQRIFGNRHHYWRMNPQDPELTLSIHEAIGLDYDMSLAHERYLGWRRGMTWPFFPFYSKERRELKTLQLSTMWMDDHLFHHQKENPGDRFQILKGLSDRVIKQGGCLLIDVHDYVFDEVLFPQVTSTYSRLLEYIMNTSSFWVDTPVNVVRHWKTRASFILDSSEGFIEGQSD